MPPREDETIDATVLRKLVKAFEYLDYDVAFLGREEKEIMSSMNVFPDKKRRTAQEEPVTIYRTKDDHHIGFIRFPSLEEEVETPSADLIEHIADMVKEARKKTDLLVGLSDWGWVRERDYIAQSPEYMPDILLGSGVGSGATGRMDENRRCSWNRPYSKGKTVVEIQVMTWPDRTKPAAWVEPNSIQSRSIGLGDKYLDNPAMNALFQ